jgi:hypothetical protein
MLNTFNQEQLKWLYEQLKEISGLPTDDHIFNGLCEFEDKIQVHIEHENNESSDSKQNENTFKSQVINYDESDNFFEPDEETKEAYKNRDILKRNMQ